MMIQTVKRLKKKHNSGCTTKDASTKESLTTCIS